MRERIRLWWSRQFRKRDYDFLRGRKIQDDRALFADQLADLLELQVALPDAVEQLARESQRHLRTNRSALNEALQGLWAALQAGSGLAMAVAGERAFPGYWAGHLAAAERVGRLPQSLRRLSQLETRSTPRGTPYLWILLACSLVIPAFMAMYILPIFRTLYEGMSLDLPDSTAALMNTVKFVRNPATWSLLVPLGIVLWLLLRRRPWRRIPAVHRLDLLAQQRTAIGFLVCALEAGMPLQEALDSASLALPLNSPVAAALRPEGRTSSGLASLLDSYPKLFSPRLRWLARGGEKEGQLPETLATLLESLDLEYEMRSACLQHLTETGLMLALGCLFAFLVVAFMAPLNGLITALSGALLP